MDHAWAVVSEAARDPLIVAFFAIALGVVVARIVFRRSPLGRAIVRVALLVLLTIALLRGGIVPYRPLQSTDAPLHDLAVAVLKMTWWLWGAWLLVGFVRALLVFERRPPEGKLVQDLVTAVSYVAAVFAIIAYVLDLPIQGVLATSGIIAIILGLALQSTMNDLFSGLVLTFTRPYRPDDWIKLEGGTEGRVIEMDWRATSLLTGQHDLAIVPNSTIAKSKIVNVSYPSGVHGITITIEVDARHPPAMVVPVLEHALLNSRTIVRGPKPSIVISSITGDYNAFELTFFVREFGDSTRAQYEIFELTYRHLAAAGINLASSLSASGTPDDAVDDQSAGIERLLQLVTIFAALTNSERSDLAKKLKQHYFDDHDVLVKPEIIPKSLFIVGDGVLSVTRQEGGVDVEVLRLGPGDFYGEVGMLTGAASLTTITALTPGVVHELTKADLAPILEARPPVAKELSRALAQHQAAGRSTASPDLAKNISKYGLSHWFSERVHRLFEIDE